MAAKKSFLSERMGGIEKTLIRQIYDRADTSCINLGLGELSFPTPGPILRHVKENIEAWKLGYTPNAGFQELRELIAANSGLDVAADQVCVTIGAEEAIFAALMVTVNPGDEVAVPDPGFPAYTSIVKMAGGVPSPYPLYRENRFSLKAVDLEKILTDRTKIVIINSPNNPSGAVYDREQLKTLAGLLDERDLMALSDEVYRDIFFDQKPDSIGRYLRNCVIVNSLSKTFSMTGWRLGWCIAPGEICRSITVFQQLSVTCPAVVSQQAAIFALKGFAEQDRQGYQEELRKRRDLAMKCFDRYTDIPYLKPEGTFYLFVDISGKMRRTMNSLDIALRLLLEKKVVTIPGTAFGRLGEGYLRISFAPEADQIEEGIRRIGQFFS
jgi:aspartate/methionine/tyrosine aminotransferase